MSGTPWERYQHPELAAVWYSPEGVGIYRYVHRVSIAVARAQEKRLMIPIGTAAALERVDPDLERILQIQAEGENHLLRCYIRMVLELLEDHGDGQYTSGVHYLLTSFDLEDTAKCLMLSESAEILVRDLDPLKDVLRDHAIRYKHTLKIGRTHGIQARPITFGKECLDWLDPLLESQDALREAARWIRRGKISGAVGIYAQDPGVEEDACSELGLVPMRVSTQIIHRSLFANFFSVVTVLYENLVCIAEQIRLGQKTEIRELQEPAGKTGSSAMPHKSNPEKSEQVTGLGKVVRGLMAGVYENIVTWDQRDLTQSSHERLAHSSMLVLTGYAVMTMTRILQGLKVNEERMRRNLDATNGAIYAEELKTALQDRGVSQGDAYDWAREVARRAYDDDGDLVTNSLAHERICRYLSETELRQVCSPETAYRYLDQIYARFDL